MLFAAVRFLSRAADTATVDDTAHFLAGMLPSADSPLTPLTKDPAWQRHAKFFDTAFAQLEQRQLSKIRAWSDTNLAAPRPTMFYMFSGPDFLYADAFYSQGLDLCAERARAGRARCPTCRDCRAAASRRRSTMSSARWARS